MPTVIVVRDGVVVAVDSFESLQASELFWPDALRLELQPGQAVGVGWSFDGQAFIAPEVEAAPSVRVMTRLEFLRRIPMEARLLIRDAAKTDPVIEDAMALLDAATEINLDDSDTVQFVGYLLEVRQLLTQEQASAILA